MKPAALLLACATLAAAPAYACSPVRDYRVPGNYALIRDADLVVLGRVKSGPSVETLVGRSSPLADAPEVAIEPIRAIKGVLPPEPLAVEGYVSQQGKAFTSHPTPLHQPHPSALNGACIRQEYAVGTLVVAIFRRTDKGWRQDHAPFARSVEDVEGLQGVWVRAADSYAAIARLPGVEAQRAAMRREIERLLALKDDPAAPAIAADLQEALDALG